MARFEVSLVQSRKAELAGGVVLQVLEMLPNSATAKLLRELIDLTLIDPTDRALFEFLDRRRDDDEGLPVSNPCSPVLRGGAAADLCE